MFLHPGNRLFRQLVADSLREYSNSNTSKLQKGIIIRHIVSQVRLNSPDGGFVKWDSGNGRWYEVGDFLAREKVSQAFRDALHEQYKSSNTAKKLRRLQSQHPSSLVKNIGNQGGDESMKKVNAVPDCSAVSPIKSCHPLVQLTGRPITPIHSRSSSDMDQTLVLKAKLSIMDALLAMSNSLMKDVAAQYQPAAVTSCVSVGNDGVNLPVGCPVKQPMADSSMSMRHSGIGLAANPMSMGNSGIGLVDPAPHHDLSNEVFDRLANLIEGVGEGDPFEPLPVVTDRVLVADQFGAI